MGFFVADQQINKVIQLLVLNFFIGNYLLGMRFVVQSLMWSLKFKIHNKSQSQYRESLKLQYRLRYPNVFLTVIWQGQGQH